MIDREARRARIAALGGVRVALLFGSQATGRARPDSDDDLTVLPQPGLDLVRWTLDLAEHLDVYVVDLRRAGVPLLDAMLAHGELVYESEPGAAAAWRGAAWMQQETDRPWYRRMARATLRRLAGP